MQSIYLKIAKTIAPYLIGMLIGGLVVGWAQGVRIKSVKTDLRTAEQSLKTCTEANTVNQSTITALQQDVKEALQGCDSRLKVKDRTLAALKRIDILKSVPANNAVKPVSNISNTGDNDETDGNTDPLLDELNCMYSSACRPGRKD